jgi:peptidyl-prolyl cis-trans isomerase B (cyclophilin B)
MIRRALLFLPILLFLTSCGSSAETSSMAEINQTAPPKAEESIAVLQTNKGVIKFKFFPEIAPETVKNFTELAKRGFYNGLTFHRVIPDFMIQGGDPSGNGSGGETYKGPGTTLKAEFSTRVKHVRGIVSMARRGNDVNSASSQFFIVQNKSGADFLDNQYTIFGQVFEGMDVVDAIANVKRDAGDKPLEPVVILSVVMSNL